MSRRKLLNAALFISSLTGYLQWGTGQHAFLFQAEWQVLSKLWVDPLSAIHPLTIVPMAGQLLLIATLIQKKPSRLLTFAAMGSLGLLMVFILLAGVLGGSVMTILSIAPFLFFSGWIIKHERKLAVDDGQA